jgi:hypothetical protein
MRRPSVGTVVAPLALFVALGGPAEAAKLVNGKNIRKGTVSSKQIKDRSIGLADLSTTARRALQATAAGTIGSAELRDGGVAGVDLAGGAVGGGQLADNAVTSPKIANNSVGTDDIGPDAVQGDEIANGSVGSGDVRDGAIGAAEIATNAVGGAEIATGAVNTDEIQSSAVGTNELADNAVGSAEVADGSLTGKDVAELAGGISVLLSGDLDEGFCDAQNTAALTVGGDGTLLDDVISITAPASLGDGLVVTARPASANTIRVQVCNVDGGANQNLGQTPFRVVATEVG